MSYYDKHIEDIKKCAKVVCKKGIGINGCYTLDEIREAAGYKNPRYTQSLKKLIAEMQCLEYFVKSLKVVLDEDIQRLTEEELQELQGIVLNVVNSALEKGYVEDSQKLIKMIARDKLSSEKMSLENQELITKDLIVKSVEACARIVVKRSAERDYVRHDEVAKYRDLAETILFKIDEGCYGKKLKQNEEFVVDLLNRYNHYINSSMPNKSSHKYATILKKAALSEGLIEEFE